MNSLYCPCKVLCCTAKDQLNENGGRQYGEFNTWHVIVPKYNLSSVIAADREIPTRGSSDNAGYEVNLNMFYKRVIENELSFANNSFRFERVLGVFAVS